MNSLSQEIDVGQISADDAHVWMLKGGGRTRSGIVRAARRALSMIEPPSGVRL
jgi:ABC-type taurine transport system ATPase subunit